ncbi:LuxR C-terminal-related transcriptional regulator [Umezawaea endophytica]|uniref:LuxR C-terminal-related transcriptional regulator n=1 Tax=Umezawaea endophytica TaxID=1654476 RepID=A0A9X2VHZ7_9PSEU|nr:LuxR C-terminal-related transcriptional regulator [Umezawaea endophytica]MCS7477006.1 LuxR C-terminal-related transcriptional regulator [Umezawaea endophytica]
MHNGQNDAQNCEHHSGCARKHGFGQVLPGAGAPSTAEYEAFQPVGCWTLSSLQAKILEGVAAGFSSGRLSRELYLSSKTIDYHVRVMSDKLKAPNRVALVSRAFVLEILRTDSWPPRVTCETVD